MINLFKKLRITFWGLLLLGFLFYIFVDFFYKWCERIIPSVILSPVVLIGFLIIYYVCVIFIINRAAKAKYNKLRTILSEDCNPPEFIESVNHILKDARVNNLYVTLQLELVRAYMELQQLSNAKEILEETHYFPDNKIGILNEVLYYSSYFKYYINEDDVKMAETVLKDINNFMKNKMSVKDSVRKIIVNNCKISINLKQGVYDGAEQYYQNQFNSIQNMLTKVSSKFELGKIYMHYNRTVEAKEAFMYVINHGNKLYKVQEAKEYFKELSSGSSD